jgi:hypothetical protein
MLSVDENSAVASRFHLVPKRSVIIGGLNESLTVFNICRTSSHISYIDINIPLKGLSVPSSLWVKRPLCSSVAYRA